MISIGQLADWIIANRKDAAFKGYTKDKIIQELVECCDNNSMLCITGPEGILGVICCRKDVNKQVMFVYDILTTKKGIVKRMLDYFVKTYPNYTIVGHTRTGRPRSFTNAEKLKNRM